MFQPLCYSSQLSALPSEKQLSFFQLSHLLVTLKEPSLLTC